MTVYFTTTATEEVTREAGESKKKQIFLSTANLVMVATKPHVIKAVLLIALTVHCPIQLPTLPARTAWGCVRVPAWG